MTLERINALTDERMKCYNTMQKILADQEKDKAPLSPEQKANWEQAFNRYNETKKEIDELKTDIDRKHQLESIEQELFSVSKKDKQPHLILVDKIQKPDGGKLEGEELYKKQLEGLRLFFFGKADRADLVKFGLAMDVIPKGGVFNPPTQWSKEILVALRPLSRIRGLAKILPAMPAPGSFGRFGMGAAGRPVRVGEKQRAAFDESITFSQREMFTHDQEYTIKISNKLLANPELDILAYVKEEAARAFAEEQEGEFILGNGFKKPLGFMFPSNDGVPASRHYQDHGSNSAVSVDAFRILPKYVHESLRPGGVYIAHTDIVFSLLLKKDTTNQYLWQPSVQAGVPDRFNGYPFITADKMPNTIGSNALVAAFANFQEYVILDSSQMDLSEEPHLYWETKETAYAITTYNDGQPNRKEAFAISKMSA